MPNAMTAGQQGQAQWLKEWHQRQKQQNPKTYNTGWEPEAGWRGRFNQSQPKQPVHSQPHNPGQPQPEGPRVPVNTPGVPYAPPPPPPKPWTPGFRTLAPVGVAEGGWGGGALEWEQLSPEDEQARQDYLNNPQPPHPPVVLPPQGSGDPLYNGTPGDQAAHAGYLNNPPADRPPVVLPPKVSGATKSGGTFAAPQSPWAPPAPGTSRRALNPAPQSWSGFGGFGTPSAAPAYPGATLGQTGQWSSQSPWAAPASQPSRRPLNAMNQYKGSVNWSKPNSMQEY